MDIVLFRIFFTLTLLFNISFCDRIHDIKVRLNEVLQEQAKNPTNPKENEFNIPDFENWVNAQKQTNKYLAKKGDPLQYFVTRVESEDGGRYISNLTYFIEPMGCGHRCPRPQLCSTFRIIVAIYTACDVVPNPTDEFVLPFTKNPNRYKGIARQAIEEQASDQRFDDIKVVHVGLRIQKAYRVRILFTAVSKADGGEYDCEVYAREEPWVETRTILKTKCSPHKDDV